MLAVTIALGFLEAVPATAGSDHDRGRGSYAVPCSLNGVNPVFHPRILAIRPSPKPIMVSSKGGTKFGTWSQTVKSPAFIEPGAERSPLRGRLERQTGPYACLHLFCLVAPGLRSASPTQISARPLRTAMW
jgi:hypothetical protein